MSGTLNVCRTVCPGFETWMYSLYNLPNKFSPEKAQLVVKEVWRKVLLYNQEITRGGLKQGKEYNLFTDWSVWGFGYVLVADALDSGIIMGINSKKTNGDMLSSYLGNCRL